jgi:hypothetical protein
MGELYNRFQPKLAEFRRGNPLHGAIFSFITVHLIKMQGQKSQIVPVLSSNDEGS